MTTSCIAVCACLAAVVSQTGISDAFVMPTATVGAASSAMAAATTKSAIVYRRSGSQGGWGLSMSMDEGSTRGVCIV